MFGVEPFSTGAFSETAGTVTGLPAPGMANIPLNRNQQFDFSVNVMQALLWQYNEADALISIMQSEQDWYDANQRDFWSNWYRDVFDLRTADDFGCAVWSIILRLPLAIEYTASNGKNWGFADFAQNFEHGNFAPAPLSILPLTTAQKRLALQLRYFQLITRGAVPEINAFMKRIFSELGSVYVEDNLDMTMTYHFQFVLPSALAFLLKFYDLLPRPAGVAADYTSL